MLSLADVAVRLEQYNYNFISLISWQCAIGDTYFLL